MLTDDMILYAGPNEIDYIDLVVFTIEGKKIMLEVKTNNTFGEIQAEIEKRHNIDFTNSIIIYNSKIMESNTFLNSELRSPFPTLFIASNNRADEYVMCYIQFGNSLLMEVDAPPKFQIKYIKSEIQKYYRINKSQVKIYNKDVLCRNEDQISQFADGKHVVVFSSRLSGQLDVDGKFQGMAKKFIFDSELEFGQITTELQQAITADADKTIYYHGDKLLDSTLIWSLYDIHPKFTIGDPIDEQYAKMVKEKYEPMVASGDPSACYAYGMILLYGIMVQKDIGEGLRYLTQAIEKRHMQACIAYLKLLKEGIIPNSPEISEEKVIQVAADANDRSAMYLYGKLLESQNRIVEAEKYFKQSSDAGYILSKTHLGRLGIKGARTISIEEGFLMLDQAARAGHASAMKSQAKQMSQTSQSESEILMERAANAGSSGASLCMAISKLEANDPAAAMELIEKSAKMENVKGMRYYGIALHRGKITKKNSKLAYEYLKKASDLGDIPARYHLSKALIEGDGIEPNAQAAFALLSSIYMMYIPAAILLTNMRLRGIGCDRDPVQAMEMARYAMSRGSYKAMRIVGMMEKDGIGCQKEAYKAQEHFKEAAPHDVIALFQYALMLKLSANEGTKNMVINMLEEASSKGLPDADQELALMFMNEDITKSIYHFNVAARAGLPLSMYNLAHMWIGMGECTQAAINYMRGAADKDVPLACYEYAKLIAEGKVENAGENEEIVYLRKATVLGVKDAEVDLGIIFYKQGDFQQAADHLRRAYDAGVYRGISFYVLSLERMNYPSHEILRWERIGAEHNDIICLLRLGNYSMEEKKFDDAASIFIKAMEQGSYEAIYQYATMLEGGKGIEKNLDLAVEYHKRAVENGVVDSLVALGRILSRKDYANRNPIEALNYYKMAADKGNYHAVYGMATLLREGDDGVPKDVDQSYKLFRDCYEHEYWLAAYDLGLMTEIGEGCEKNGFGSMQYFKTGMEHNVLKCLAPYARNKFFGVNCDKDIDIAKNIMQTGINLRDPDSTFLYGEVLAAEGNLEAATNYYLMASDFGNIEAMNAAAVILAQNVETVTKAAELFQKAADLGDPIAACNIGIMLASGNGVLRDYTKAMNYLQRAVKTGNVEAMYNIAVLMVKMNKNGLYDAEIRDYFKKAADGGNTQAMYNLGILLTEKETKDYKTGMRYLRMAANKGIENAAYKYSYNTLTNSEGRKDDELAMEYCKQAVAAGNFDALCLYGVMLLNGRGAPASISDALQCFRLGVESGHLNSMYNYAMVQLNSNPDAKTYQESVALLKRAAELGCEHAVHQCEVYHLD
ncbi:hypothetical protein TVAG_452440 [Trichomonas vaginalis G3]|uniref:Ubiquitin-like domain-containing protein n=1 Tax=Trichomonas vaginalis (strain ATCC PRA-98 / G3) TaxID=412133 RepID=A2DJW6_TRIV3|nr:SEL-1-like protein family [Trichomonas vaginalis G3]EAY19330.1 hypothetical protein TVAG_452440 [Trichomonas vaginalis G3]KAI5527230.1 SEL-1-like protein family [Trichomonas vaginalis G3]|eukprot:XP_001580316.1 hypothetical protein [Trichomonas vaginalis G3]